MFVIKSVEWQLITSCRRTPNLYSSRSETKVNETITTRNERTLKRNDMVWIKTRKSSTIQRKMVGGRWWNQRASNGIASAVGSNRMTGSVSEFPWSGSRASPRRERRPQRASAINFTRAQKGSKKREEAARGRVDSVLATMGFYLRELSGQRVLRLVAWPLAYNVHRQYKLSDAFS